MTNQDSQFGIESDAEFADYDSAPLVSGDLGRKRAGKRVGQLWDRWNVHADDSDVARVRAAQRIAQAMVDAFTAGSEGFEVSLGVGGYGERGIEMKAPAVTDMLKRRIYISPAPLLGSLPSSEAGEILSGLALHEISHSRYGTETRGAARRAFAHDETASILSNLLDDIRIERRFVEEYPGFAGVFTQALDWVAQTEAAAGHTASAKSLRTEPLACAIAATRYDEYTQWPADVQAEREWWQDWAARWAREDSPRRHVAGVREALQHILAQIDPQPQQGQKPEQKQGKGQGTPQPGAGQGKGSDAQGSESQEQGDGSSESQGEGSEQGEGSGAGSGQGEADEQGGDGQGSGSGDGQGSADSDSDGSEGSGDGQGESDKELAARATAKGAGGTGSMKPCPTEALTSVSTPDRGSIAEAIAQVGRADASMRVAVREAGVLPARQMAEYAKRQPDGAITRAVRSAFERNRTGRNGAARMQKRGRVDGSRLANVVQGDYRVFERPGTPSKSVLVYVMVDASGSMQGPNIKRTIDLAQALAAATRGVSGIRMRVLAWTRDQGAVDADVFPLWATGEPLDHMWRVLGVSMGGTPDAPAIDWAAKAIRREAHGETPLVLVLTDGIGDYGWRDRMPRVVAEARAHGVQVEGVAVGEFQQDAEARMERIYGSAHWTHYSGEQDMGTFARPIANLILKAITKE
jgi:Mg-chelatase subunit ChlD